MQTNLFHRFHFSFEEVQPLPEEIRSFLKSEDSGDDNPVNSAIREIIPQLTDNDGITGGYMIKKADDVRLDIGALIKGYMRKADWLALFVCTAGTVFTGLMERYNAEGDYLEAFVTDAIGSLTVEKAMDRIQDILAMEMQTEGLRISNRYSPGYCNWPVAGQRELFEQMGDFPVAVSLTESCLMLPIKSVSGIIGVGAHIRKYSYSCEICRDKDCIYRKLLSEL
ncbi:MAG: hypothetical protein LBE91_22315 [Tannerella sp.]|jgi:hypothetical protein|nr:hypothetical protein [Tannerella sp.]